MYIILFSGAFLMILFCLHSINRALQFYIVSIQKIICLKQLDENALSEMVDIGFTLLDLVRQVNDLFGKVFALDYTSIMIMNIVGVFNSLTIFTALSEQEPELIYLSFSGIFIVILNMIKLYSYTCIGQALSKAYSNTNEGLDKVLLLEGIGVQQRREIEFLVNRFSTTSPIRPLDMFDMNSANFAVMHNIMLTYVVILMQFKGSF